MSAQIFQFRPFQNARDEARKYCPSMTKQALAQVREEQQQGHSGSWVAGQIMQLRMACAPTPPKDAA
jgi:hypothetical protein